jgi:hypothetical protein
MAAFRRGGVGRHAGADPRVFGATTAGVGAAEVAELVEATGPFDRLRDLARAQGPRAGGCDGAAEVAELVEATGPFDRLRDLA